MIELKTAAVIPAKAGIHEHGAAGFEKLCAWPSAFAGATGTWSQLKRPITHPPLAPAHAPPHISLMTVKARIAVLRQSPALRLAAFILGCLLMLAAPLAGLLPGPGGIFIFAVGLGLALRSSIWAKRRYVKLKRQQPKLGGWADWGLRRGSAKRRGEVAKRKQSEHSEIDDSN
jgi:hypothetical protein